MYPNVATEEIERLYEFMGLTLNDVATACNEPIVYSNLCENPDPTWMPVTANMLMYTCMAELFHMIEDTGTKTWADYPAWVRELYERASACERFDTADLMSGEVAVL